MSNLFTWLGSSFGKEDFFTASIAFFIARNSAFRRAFLVWLETVTNEPLDSHSWEVGIQTAFPSRLGTSILDMRLANPEIELWFEHKLGSGLGHYETEDGEQADQLEKYLDAASRVMNGRKNGTAEVHWPTDGPVENQPRILLFYISRDGTSLDKERYVSRLHSANTQGLVWPTSGQLRWRDFWPSAQEALAGVLEGENGEFERDLSRQFLDYWKSLPGMWLQEVFDHEWLSLLPEDIPNKEKAPFDVYLREIEKVAVSKLEWQRKVNYKGIALEFRVPTGPVDHVTFQAMRRVDDIDVPVTELGHELFRLIFRARENLSRWETPPVPLGYDKWKGTATIQRKQNREFMCIYLGVQHWNSCDTQEERTAAVTEAFGAGVKMFEISTGVSIPGAEGL